MNRLPVLLVLPLLVGCAAKQKPQPLSAPPTPDHLDTIRTSYRAVFPNARVGVVTAVLAGEPFALVGRIDVESLRPGQVVSFLDGEESVIASGKIVKVDPDAVTVSFEPGRRAPQVGDAAIKF